MDKGLEFNTGFRYPVDRIKMKKILTILKIPGIVVGSLAALYTIFTFFDGMKDDITDIKDTQVEYQATADTIMHIAMAYDERITANKEATEYNAGQLEVVIDSYLEYLKHDSLLTKDEFVDYMNPFLEYIKKNSSSKIPSVQTPLVGNGGESIIALTKEKSNSSQ